MRNKFLVPLMFTGIILLIGFSHCTHDPVKPTGNNGQDPCDPDTVYFKNDIDPIFTSTCATSGCHDAETAQNGVNLTSYSNIIETGDVEAFSPEDSKIYEMITEEEASERMPPGGQLPQEQIDAIYTWIAQGAKNNECNEKQN
ncbi:MAG: hypothetical protein K9I94_15980 [Bacteroidales bacterium]|nr:hypothetical protein [Bacteroidales bacterium]